MKIFEATYSGESLIDVHRDVSEAFQEDYNPIVGQIPSDEHGFQEGNFKITVEWSSTDDFETEAEQELRHLRGGETVILPKNKEQAESMICVACSYLDSLREGKTK